MPAPCLIHTVAELPEAREKALTASYLLSLCCQPHCILGTLRVPEIQAGTLKVFGLFLFSLCVCVCPFVFVIVCLVLCLPSVFVISTACPQWGQTQVLQEQTPVDNPNAEVGEKNNWAPGAVWLRKKTESFSNSCTGWKLNPHNQLVRLCVCGIYKRAMSVPTKEHPGYERTSSGRCGCGGRIRVWTIPTTGPETGIVLEGIQGRRRWTVTHSKEKDTDSWDSCI